MTRLQFGTDTLCRYCKGSGMDPRVKLMQLARYCPRCGGSGVIVNAVPLARKLDPPTSHQAAQDAMPKAHTNRALALAVLREAGADGLTDFELAERTGVPQTSIGVRRKELVEAGYVTSTGRTRPAPSGSAAIVWRVV